MLSAYDDLIENNQKQIKLLEEAAQRLYKEWFVDLRFPGHEESKIVDGVPEGWKKVQLGEVFTTVLGGTPSRNKIDYWGGNIPWINSGAVNNLRIVKESEFITELGLSNSSTKIMPVHTTVLAITGATLGQVSYTEIEVCANQSVVGVYDSKDIYNEFIYLTISNKIKEIISEAMGGAQQHINKDVVNRFEVVMPDNDINKKLKNQIKPLFKKIINLCCDIENLKEARDRLLPKLMNGEIEV
jgi:type I restriction enzyme S subunit